MKRNKIIVEESRINHKKIIVAKYRKMDRYKNKEEIEKLKVKDEKNYVVEESEKSPEYEEKINKLEITYKQRAEKKEVKELENEQEVNREIKEPETEEEINEEVDELEVEEEVNEEVEELEIEEEVNENIEELEIEEEINEEVEELEIEEELNEEIYEVQENEEIKEEGDKLEDIKEEIEEELNEEIYEVEEKEIKQESEKIEVEIDNKKKLQEYIEENNIAEKDRYETSYNLSLEYSGQIYKDRRIIFDPPKNDKIVSITNINRDIYVNDVEILENGVNVKAAISVSINYGTSKDIFKQEEKCKENKEKNSIILESDIKEVILTDGVVRNTTVLIPCDIYINIPEVNCFDKLRIIRGNLRTTNTQYILDNGDITNAIIPIGHSLKGMMERYILSIEVEVI